MRMFNFTDNRKVRKSAPAWTRKIGKVVSAIFDLDNGSHPVATIADEDTFTGSTTNGTNLLPDLWRVYNDRKSVYQDIERMIAEDEIVSTAIDIVADRCIGVSDARQSFKKKPKRSSFSVTSEDKKVESILRDLNRRLNIEQEIWQIIHECYPHGNAFREVIIDRKAMNVKGFKQTITYQVWPKTNEHGDKLPGWIIVTDQDVASSGGKELEEWQIVPFIYGVKKGFLAVAPLASARRNWQRLSKMEDGMAIARLVRAYDKMVHKIPIKSEWTSAEIMSTIRKYKDAITKRKLVASDGSLMSADNPLDVQTDFYLPDDGSGKGNVSILSANNAQLGNLNDVLYHREKLICRLKVPINYLQLLTSQKTHMTAGQGMDSADISFAYTLQRVQNVIIEGLRRLYDLELMLHGIAPSEDLYTIELALIITKDRVEDANIELTYAQAAVYFVEAFGALPADLIADKFMQLNHEQQDMMTRFLEGDARKVWESKLGALSPKQSIRINDMVDVVYSIYQGIADDMRAKGEDIPTLNEADRDEIRDNILSRVSQNDELKFL